MKKFIIGFILTLTSFDGFSCTDQEIDKLNQKLSNFESLTMDFNEGNKFGKIYIKKPEMMRIDYELPQKISIIIKDGVITYYDHQLDELTKIKQDPKFLTFLAKKNINFKKDFETFVCNKRGDEINLDLSIKGEDENIINIKMRFLQYNLNKADIYSDKKHRSTLFFKDLRYNKQLEIARFNFKDKSFYNIE